MNVERDVRVRLDAARIEDQVSVLVGADDVPFAVLNVVGHVDALCSVRNVNLPAIIRPTSIF